MTSPPDDLAGKAALRALPSVSALLERAAIRELVREHGRAAVVEAIRCVVDRARGRLLSDREATVSEQEIRREIGRSLDGSLRPVLNATGVVVHTNLGRAPLARRALNAVAEVAAGYSTLEYDVEAGQRGDRAGHAVDLLGALTGAEDALVVNNNAAAVLLALSSWAAGREVIVSRGELVEIGGGFRIPDVLRQSGARLVEVGTTNRTRIEDYVEAISEQTAVLLKVHRSNFEIVGFTSEVTIAELSRVAHENGLPLFFDAGSGNLLSDVLGALETNVAAALGAGADLVMFSGDKLLGGPQAGVAVGQARLISAMRRHPLMRAVRPDKLCLAALRATLLLLRDAPDEVPVVRMLRMPLLELERRTERLRRSLRDGGHDRVEIVRAEGRVGGGAAPSRSLESRALRISGRDAGDLCRALRLGDPPVIARIEDGATLLDLRCVPAELDPVLTRAVLAALEP